MRAGRLGALRAPPLSANPRAALSVVAAVARSSARSIDRATAEFVLTAAVALEVSASSCWAWRRQFPHGRGDVGPWPEPRHDLLDLTLAAVSGLVQQRPVVLGREMRAKQTDRGEGDIAGARPVQDEGKATPGPARLDAMVGRVLREMEHLRAVGEQRGAPLAKIETTGIELGKRRDQRGGGLRLASGEALHLANQLAVGQPLGGPVAVHAFNICSPFSPLDVVAPRPTAPGRSESPAAPRVRTHAVNVVGPEGIPCGSGDSVHASTEKLSRPPREIVAGRGRRERPRRPTARRAERLWPVRQPAHVGYDG